MKNKLKNNKKCFAEKSIIVFIEFNSYNKPNIFLYI